MLMANNLQHSEISMCYVSFLPLWEEEEDISRKSPTWMNAVSTWKCLFIMMKLFVLFCSILLDVLLGKPKFTCNLNIRQPCLRFFFCVSLLSNTKSCTPIPAMWSEFLCSASQHQKSTVKTKSPQTFVHLVDFQNKMCLPCLIIMLSCYFD